MEEDLDLHWSTYIMPSVIRFGNIKWNEPQHVISNNVAFWHV